MDSTTTPAQGRQPASKVAVRPALPRRAVAPKSATELSVTLHRSDGGVILELEERSTGGWRVAIIAAFTQPSAFEEWCADDPLRFEQPLMHQQLRRQAAELWRSEP